MYVVSQLELYCMFVVSHRGMVHSPIPILARVTSDEFTARDSSMGSSGGTTEVMMRTHSRRSLYLLRSGSSVPVWCGG